MACHLIRIAQEIFVGMGIGTVKRTTVMVDVGTDVIINVNIIIIETHHQITHSQAFGETVVEEDLLEVAVQVVIPQVTRTVVEEVPAVAEVQEDILQALPALPALPAVITLTMIEVHQVEEVIPAVADHLVVEVALAVVAEQVDTK